MRGLRRKERRKRRRGRKKERRGRMGGEIWRMDISRSFRVNHAF